jgi:hypothetical protein
MIVRLIQKRRSEKGLPSPLSLLTSHFSLRQAVKLLPQPQPPLAFGLLKVKPEPCIELT